MKGWQGLGGKLGITGHTGLLGKVGIRAGGGGSGGNLFKGTYWFSPMVNNGDDTVTDGAWIDTCLSPKNVLLTSGIETIPPQTPAIFPNHAVTRVSDELLYTDENCFLGDFSQAGFSGGIRESDQRMTMFFSSVQGKYGNTVTDNWLNAILTAENGAIVEITSIVGDEYTWIYTPLGTTTQQQIEEGFGYPNTFTIDFPQTFPRDDLITLRESVGDNVFETIPVSGLLAEPESENLVPYSEDLENTILTRAIVTTTISAPDGGLAHKLSANADNSTHRSDQNAGVVNGNYYYLSFFAKPDEFNCIQSSVGEFAVQANFSSFNLSTKAVNNFGDSVGSIEEVSDGWFLCKQRVLSGAAGRISIGIGNNNSYILTGNNIDGLYVWGIECKENGFSSYIKTDGAPATRASNVASCPTSNALIDDGFYTSDRTEAGTFTNGVRRVSDSTFNLRFNEGGSGTVNGKYVADVSPSWIGAIFRDNPEYTVTSTSGSNQLTVSHPNNTEQELIDLFGNDGTNSNKYRIDFQRAGFTVAEVEQLRADVNDTPPTEFPDGSFRWLTWKGENVVFKFKFILKSDDPNELWHIEWENLPKDTFVARTGDFLEFTHGNDTLSVPYANLLLLNTEYFGEVVITPTELIGFVDGLEVARGTRTDTDLAVWKPRCYGGGFETTLAPILLGQVRVEDYIAPPPTPSQLIVENGDSVLGGTDTTAFISATAAPTPVGSLTPPVLIEGNPITFLYTLNDGNNLVEIGNDFDNLPTVLCTFDGQEFTLNPSSPQPEPTLVALLNNAKDTGQPIAFTAEAAP